MSSYFSAVREEKQGFLLKYHLTLEHKLARITCRQSLLPFPEDTPLPRRDLCREPVRDRVSVSKVSFMDETIHETRRYC